MICNIFDKLFIKYGRQIGIITDITEIKEERTLITIRFTDNRIDKLPLELVVQSELILLGSR